MEDKMLSFLSLGLVASI